jgi:DNA mismatch repair protein MutH
VKAPGPASVDELLARAQALAGATIGELARARGRALPETMTRGKGFVGSLIELALGASAGSRAEPDFPALGVELKTLPMSVDGRVIESTFVATIPLTALSNLDYASSPIGAKLARVLFVPVEGRPVPLADRRIGAPLLWTPNDAERGVLERDFEAIAELIGRGELERVSAHAGEAMQVRPKGARGSDRVVCFDEDGTARREQPRGVYLRARFTAQIVARLRNERRALQQPEG